MTTKTVAEADIRTERTERLVFYTNATLKKKIVQEAAKKNVSISTWLQSQLLGKFSNKEYNETNLICVSFSTCYWL